MAQSSQKNKDVDLEEEQFKAIFSTENKPPLIDVRSPAEYAKGHIKGSINIPLLDNDQRAEVGTLYKQVNPQAAFDKGLEIVGPKMLQFVTQARNFLQDQEGLVYCWRGGKRSNSMSWLFNMSGLKTKAFQGGYKAYRKQVAEILAKHPAKFLVLGGKTGSGKTLLLEKLKESGEQVIDLEGLANHKGSAFGWIGEEPQPAVEQFENLLAHQLVAMDTDKPIWLENESRMIGRIPIHEAFWKRLKSSALINIDIPTQVRVKHLSKIYDVGNIEDLKDAFHRIQKRLGGLNLKHALQALDNNDLEKAAEIALLYYDKSYTNLLESNIADPIYRLTFAHGDFDKITQDLITFKNKISE